ncbi:MAG: T9SS type A sorting domain-containing protein [Saprospiraceae bacterium]|nr:T9SS type A sorting domain-containing protein [Saprospiraceae bacterium]
MRSRDFLLQFAFALLSISSQAQGFTNWITGDSSDAVVSGWEKGIVLAGGGGDNDQAMIWMLERAAGGDVLVLRASGSDGYNDYFFSDLGVQVNSVETIRFDGIAAANSEYVLRRIEEAEVLFFAGGDQYDYYTFWKDNAVEAAIQYLIEEKQITLGGTSAGMAILGQAYYTPSSLGVLSSEALNDPFHEYMDVIGFDDFLHIPFLEETITDTHFDQRNRAGRFITFLARLTQDFGFRSKGIASNEYTAICVDEAGLAHCFGSYPDYPEDVVYFAQTNCQLPYIPETCVGGIPLTWNRDQQAVKVCQIPATETGMNTFDLTDWETTSGGNWMDWYVDNGEINMNSGAVPADCQSISSISNPELQKLNLFPNPVEDYLYFSTEEEANFLTYEIIDLHGRLLQSGAASEEGQILIRSLPAGYFILRLQTDSGILQQGFIK